MSNCTRILGAFSKPFRFSEQLEDNDIFIPGVSSLVSQYTCYHPYASASITVRPASLLSSLLSTKCIFVSLCVPYQASSDPHPDSITSTSHRMSHPGISTDPSNNKNLKLELAPGAAGAVPGAAAGAGSPAIPHATNGAAAGGTADGSWPQAPLGAAGVGAGTATMAPGPMSLPPLEAPKTRKKGLSVCMCACFCRWLNKTDETTHRRCRGGRVVDSPLRGVSLQNRQYIYAVIVVIICIAFYHCMTANNMGVRCVGDDPCYELMVDDRCTATPAYGWL